MYLILQLSCFKFIDIPRFYHSDCYKRRHHLPVRDSEHEIVKLSNCRRGRMFDDERAGEERVTYPLWNEFSSLFLWRNCYVSVNFQRLHRLSLASESEHAQETGGLSVSFELQVGASFAGSFGCYQRLLQAT